MRPFTRLAEAFSKKLENHAHMVALYALCYNFVQVHRRCGRQRWRPGIESRLWERELRSIV